MDELATLRAMRDRYVRLANGLDSLIKELSSGQPNGAQQQELIPAAAPSRAFIAPHSQAERREARSGPVDQNLLPTVKGVLKEQGGGPLSGDAIFKIMSDRGYRWSTDQAPRRGFGIALSNAATKQELRMTEDRGIKYYSLP